MVAKLLQPDGSLTPQRTSLTTAQTSGTPFPPSQAVAPDVATANSVVMVGSVDSGTGVVTLKSSSVRITADGIFSTPLHFKQLLEQNSKLGSQIVDIPIGTTTKTIDLALGQSINLLHDEDVALTFSNIPSGGNFITPVVIYRYKSASTTPKSLTFTHPVFSEGGQRANLTQASGAIDILCMFIDNNGVIFMRNYTNNLKTTPGTITINPTNPYRVFETTPTPRAINPNTLVATTAGGTFISTDIEVDPNDNSVFTSPVTSVNNTFYLHYYSYVTPSIVSGEVLIDCSLNSFGHLLHDGDITNFNFINVPVGTTSSFTLFRQQDATSNTHLFSLGSNFYYDTPPALTYTDSAIDILDFTTVNGINWFVQCFNNFAVVA